MTGDSLPQSVKTKFHEYCSKGCKCMIIDIEEQWFTSGGYAWSEYTISCKHYGTCEWARDILKEEE